MEQWKPVVGYEGRYLVSDRGRVESMDYCGRGHRKVLSPSIASHGYPVVNLSDGSVKKQHYVHRLVASAFLPNPDSRREVNHKNGVKHDNAVTNLEWATPSENMRHANETGLTPSPPLRRGTEAARSRLNERQVREIRSKYKRGAGSQSSIGREYGVSQTAVRSIVRRKSWSWLPDSPSEMQKNG